MNSLDTPTGAWLAAGVRTPFSKVDGALKALDAIELSAPVVRHMTGLLHDDQPDLFVWGHVVPNLAWSNIAREILMDVGASATIPAITTVMACGTSMVGAFEAAGMLDGRSRTLALVGGVDSLSRVQIGLSQPLSDWIRGFQRSRSLRKQLAHVAELELHDVRLHIPGIHNRTTGLSMGEHAELTAQEWHIDRMAQDTYALASHQRATAAWDRHFFDDLVIPIADIQRDTLPRRDSSLDRLSRLRPVFDQKGDRGTISAGNSSLLTDGAASVWVATEAGLKRLPASTPRVRLLDWELTSVDFRIEGLLMAPAFAIPRLLERHHLTYADIDLWEFHEAFAAQVLFHLKALEDPEFLRKRANVKADLGPVPRDRLNPNGGSIALGHPFGATGARILSQAVKELAALPSGRLAVVSVCTDGGQGAVALLQSA
jgi:acetyl-CoA C-acetyltransferase